jgi:hypothetical protein
MMSLRSWEWRSRRGRRQQDQAAILEECDPSSRSQSTTLAWWLLAEQPPMLHVVFVALLSWPLLVTINLNSGHRCRYGIIDDTRLSNQRLLVPEWSCYNNHSGMTLRWWRITGYMKCFIDVDFSRNSHTLSFRWFCTSIQAC